MSGSERTQELESESSNDTSTLARASPEEMIRIGVLATRRASENDLAAALDEVIETAFRDFHGRRLVLLPGAHCFTKDSRWPSSRALLDNILKKHRAAGLFEAREPGGQLAYFAYDPSAGGRLPVVIRQVFSRSDAGEARVRAVVEACRAGQRTVVISGVPVGLLVCGENNVLANVQSEDNRVVVRHVGGRELFPGDLKVVLNGAHTRMGNWGKMEKRFRWLSRSRRWAFFSTNVDHSWGTGELRAYFDGKLIARGARRERKPRDARIEYVTVGEGGMDLCRALVIEGEVRVFLPHGAPDNISGGGKERAP